MSSLLEVKESGPFQLKAYGGNPPPMVASMLPVEAPLQAMFQPPFAVAAIAERLMGGGAVSVKLSAALHPLLSVIVYV